MRTMSQNKNARFWFLVLIAALPVVFAAAMMLGRYGISPRAFWEAITGAEGRELERSILINLRLPRTLAALLVGAALSVSGLLYQEVFRNPLVSPDLLGVSGGAGTGAAIAIVLGLPMASVSIIAFIGGIAAVGLTYGISRIFRNRSRMSLVLAGIIVGGLANAALSIVKYTADSESTLASITFWLMGSFEDTGVGQLGALFGFIPVCLIASLILSWRVNVLAMGKEEAQTKGLDYKLYVGIIIGIATLMTAVSTAAAGTVGWIGLVVPHIVRRMGGEDTARTVPLAALFGAAFAVLADILSRVFFAAELPLSAITGSVGTVIFVFMIWKTRRDIVYED